MSQYNYIKENDNVNENEKFRKHLSEFDRCKIETLLNEGKNCTYIANSLNEKPRKIQHEVKQRKLFFFSKHACKECKNKNNCIKIKSCETFQAYNSCSEYKECSVFKNCTSFVRVSKCPNSKNSVTCNGCKKINSCRKTKIQYTQPAAQSDYKKKRSNSNPKAKILKINGLSEHIKNNIKKSKYSPDAIAGRLKTTTNSFEDTVCTTTIYSYINKGLIDGVSNFDLKFKVSLKQQKEKKNSNSKSTHRVGREIEKRPQEANDALVPGHFEMDLVLGTMGGEALLTFVDRFSLDLFIEKIPDKSQNSVLIALRNIKDRMSKRYGSNILKTITTDNGKEFINFNDIESLFSDNFNTASLFFANPYSSWEKGKVEQTNWVIRTYIPKGYDITPISKNKIFKIECLINNMPRKKFNYKTARETIKGYLNNVA